MRDTKRVVVVGARRKRQGTGRFVARSFHQVGAEICGIVGTSKDSVYAAQTDLKKVFGIECDGYTQLDKALDEQKPDILAVCSPYKFHLEALTKAATRGIHCLCEKPLWWDKERSDRLEITDEIINSFQKKGRLLETITQWPFTIDTFFDIYPEEKDRTIDSFKMRLSPSKQKPDLIQDSVPHLLSMLYALAGVGKILKPEITISDQQRNHWQLSFSYQTEEAEISTILDLTPVANPPRPAGFTINGKKVERKIQLPEYTFVFEANGGSYPFADPLDLLVGSFLEKVYSNSQLDFHSLYNNMSGLELLNEALEKKIHSLILS